jgi:hypothetical protein
VREAKGTASAPDDHPGSAGTCLRRGTRLQPFEEEGGSAGCLLAAQAQVQAYINLQAFCLRWLAQAGAGCMNCIAQE